GLAAQLDRLGPDEPVRVLVVLHEQADLPALDRRLRAEKAATADAVRALALHPDVARIEPDLVVELIEPAASAKAGAEKGAGPDKADVGLVPGVRAVGAPRVWQELGIDGTGVVVGILDTGVDGTPPALAARWRGNFAPAAECWFDGAGLGDTAFPVDRHYHGTHVMGILAGQAPGDTIGVAPGTLWIAANVINHPGSNEEFDNGVIASLEFMADPDGDPATSADVPAVVHNSWGVSEAFEGYFDCDSRWWDVIDAVETAGIVLTWSAGNEGPGPGTLRSPADRASSPLNAFAVGSVAPVAPHAVSSFSSRGPSGCGGADAIKPEVMAPGDDVLSARPGGGYQYLSGTSMAGPHVAGIVALMRASNPDVDVATIKQALMDTALDLGPAGEDNDSGWGLVDAYAAVTAVMGGVGEVTGTVTDQATGLPVAGAQVRLDGGYHLDTTGADGVYRLVLPAGAATFTVKAFGYVDGSLPVAVPDGGIVTADLALAPRPLAAVTGTVTGPEGETVAGATVAAEGTPVPPAVTDAAGAYGLDLPAGPDQVYTLRARAAGYGSAVQTVAVTGPLTVDIVLPPLTAEDFETGDFTSYAWQQGGDTGWQIDGTMVQEGSFSARSGTVGNYGLSRLSLAYEVLDAGELAFQYRVSSEAAYDYLRFYVDGALVSSWSGEVPWTRHVHALSAGPHTLMWSYEKDESVAAGDDAAWLDLIELPAQATPLVPLAVVQPAAVALTVGPDGTAALPLTVANDGDADLEFSVSAGAQPAVLAVENPVKHLPLQKTAVDDRTAVVRTAGAGGPDVFGYEWLDSDHPYGPAYAWVDIAADGQPVALADDQNTGPFELGFAFPFYGASYTQVRLCGNGFLSFTSTSNAWANQGIPDAVEPNNLVAPFWDDLAPNLGGQVYVRADAGRFIVQFQDVPHYGAPAVTETFQAILYADGAIVFQYAAVGNDGGCTVGIENGSGNDGLLVQFNSAGSLRDELAIRLAAVPPPTWLTAAPATGTVPPGGQATVTVTCDAAGLAMGDHGAYLSLVTNDPTQPVLAVPVTLTVSELSDARPPVPLALVFRGAVPNPFNPATEIRFELPAEARVSLRVYDVAGRLVRTLAAGRLPAGSHAVRWDGRDDRGRGAASGTYVARLVVDGVPVARSMTLLR
ncbi:MAG: S8 family serine peptidase, partial [Candidatus Krumholzibacteriia bacterium]